MIWDQSLVYAHPNWKRREELPLEALTILKWLRGRSSVLEVGCHNGDFSRWLQHDGFQVTGLEINPVALEQARPYLHQAICADIESETAWQQLQGQTFDAILFEHVLEHLANPWQVLTRAKELLRDQGIVIIALPNICNADTRFRILFGAFDYTETGIMDRTHLRFFNRITADQMIQQAGLRVEEYFSPWQVNPIREFVDHLPVLTHLRTWLPASPPRWPRFSANITDVVMMFKCKKQ